MRGHHKALLGTRIVLQKCKSLDDVYLLSSPAVRFVRKIYKSKVVKEGISFQEGSGKSKKKKEKKSKKKKEKKKAKKEKKTEAGDGSSDSSEVSEPATI